MPSWMYLVLWFTVAIPALVGIMFYGRLTKAFQCFIILMCIGLLTELLLRITIQSSSGNIYIINIYTCIEIFLLTLFFKEVVSEGIKVRIIKTGGAIVLVFVLIEMILGGFNVWVSLSSALESGFIIVAGLFYFYEVAMGISKDIPLKNANFWLIAVIMFYFMSSLEYFLLNRYLVNVGKQDLMMLGNIHTFVNAFCNLAYGLIIWKSIPSYSLVR